LVHDRELTYSIALPAGEPWQDGRPLSTRMHEIIRDAFRTLGVELELAGSERDPSTILCFRQYTPDDLLCRGAKVVGSAQRRSRGALLQHGGILLRQSAHTPMLSAICELTGVAVTPEGTRAAILNAFAEATGWELDECALSPIERNLVCEFADEKYGHARWNDKR
jgi:lipoate-protein ligase A